MAGKNEDRDATFDIMKGIGILLMLVGHWPGLPHWAHQFIYSFHMPLFFLVAGYFSKPFSQADAIMEGKDGVWIIVKKNAKRLLLPFVFTQFLLMLWCALQAFAKHNPDMLIRASLSLLWGGGDELDSPWGLIHIGPMWFLPALFFAKTTFSIIGKWVKGYWLILICVVITLVANVIERYVVWPWCILQGLSGMTFLSIGWAVKNVNFPKWLYWMAIACWPAAMLFSGLEMYGCYYQCFPLDVLGACGGTLCVWWLSRQLAKAKWLCMPLIWCGIYSLVILCFHTFVGYSSIAYSIVIHSPFELEGNAMVVFSYVLVFCMTFVVIKIPYIRKVYGVKN